jgi:thymidine kinase
MPSFSRSRHFLLSGCGGGPPSETIGGLVVDSLQFVTTLLCTEVVRVESSEGVRVVLAALIESGP